MSDKQEDASQPPSQQRTAASPPSPEAAEPPKQSDAASASSDSSSDSSSSSSSSRHPRSARNVASVESPHRASASPVRFIAVHAGAGFHNPSSHAELQRVFRSACDVAILQSRSLEEAVMLAVQRLESSPLTNAGRGSCLTEDGQVECEAAVMLGNGAFSAVGAVQGVEHPIQVAHQMLRERNELGLIRELGRVRPIFMVGEGAWRYARERGFETVEKESWKDHHVTEETRRKWRKYRDIIDRHSEQSQGQQRHADEQRDDSDGSAAAAEQSSHSKRKRSPSQSPPGQSLPYSSPASSTSSSSSSSSASSRPLLHSQHSTVGAIACDGRGQVCAGVSSGGVWMKPTGRIGSAALIGCGCHAENGDDQWQTGEDSEKQAAGEGGGGGKQQADNVSVACSISGCGEDIMEELMAVRCCDALKESKASSPSPSAHSSPVEIMTPLTEDEDKGEEGEGEEAAGSGSSSSGGGLGSTDMQRVMKQLIVKQSGRQAQFTTADKKRRKNQDGSNDTQQQDDGLSTGIIACRIVPTASHLLLEFCYAHTAPHFAIGYAVNDATNGFINRGWVSQQTQGENDRKEMKSGEVVLRISADVAKRGDNNGGGDEAENDAQQTASSAGDGGDSGDDRGRGDSGTVSQAKGKRSEERTVGKRRRTEASGGCDAR